MFYAAGGAGIAALIAACSSSEPGTPQNDAGTGGQTVNSGGAPGAAGSVSLPGQSGATAGGTTSGGSGAAATAGAPGAGTGNGSSGSPGTPGGAGSPSSGGAPNGGVGGSAPASAGTPGSAGSTTAGSAGTGTGTAGANGCGAPEQLEKFSFFVTSHKALQALSGSVDGFGGDLRYGEADGLSGADKICREIAERSMKCASTKGWRAFLSTTTGGPNGGPVHAIDRLGDGPWYDRIGRIVAMNKAALVNQRPMGADPAILMDLPNEDGVPNHAPDGELLDNHDMITGSNTEGKLYTGRADPLESTCKDWTSKERWGAPRCGHPWPTMGKGGFPVGSAGGPGFPGGFGGGSGFPGGGSIGDLAHWISALDEAGCAPGAFLVEMGPPNPNNPTIGSGGGYGGFYCFAEVP